jgi:molybdate transport system substrate-binding protein
MRRRAIALAALLVVTASVARAAQSAELTVFAAASLTNVFAKIDGAQRYSFAGSNTLAAQIEQGAPADVFASADMLLPRKLYDKDLCSKPVVFTRNGLVLVVPRSNPAKLRSVYDLRRRGVKLVVAGPSVPVGHYTLQLLRNMKLSTKILRNVVSRETDVRAVLAKVALGEADAGFVYSTDARVDPARLKVITVPVRAQPVIQYGICVVAKGGTAADAQAFVRKVLSKSGQTRLRAAGFLPRVKKN